MVPGTVEPIENGSAGIVAKRFGYPVLLKAVAGGGGKGMRLVTTEPEMAAAWRDASSEALKRIWRRAPVFGKVRRTATPH